MMFAGEEDLICNYKGIEKSIANLKWGGQVGFGNVSSPSLVEDRTDGRLPSLRNGT
jgi:carboxypeptidase D